MMADTLARAVAPVFMLRVRSNAIGATMRRSVLGYMPGHISDEGFPLWDVQIESWGAPLLIRARDAEEAEGFTRVSFKVPLDVIITVLPRKVCQ